MEQDLDNNENEQDESSSENKSNPADNSAETRGGKRARKASGNLNEKENAKKIKKTAMVDRVIEYESRMLGMESGEEQVLDDSKKDGIKCRCIGSFGYCDIYFTWLFDWGDLKRQGIHRLTGQIKLKSEINFEEETVEVDIDEQCDTVTHSVDAGCYLRDVECKFGYKLTAHCTPIEEEKVSYDAMFAPSKTTDVILEVDGKKIHANKKFLSKHSEFFLSLFSSKSKKGKLAEIPVDGVTLEDFGLLMSTIYPKPVKPTDKTVEKLLELADRFSMKSVISLVQNHLLTDSKLRNERIIGMAEKYGMKSLLEKMIDEIDTVEKVNNLQFLSKYEELSDATKLKILERILGI